MVEKPNEEANSQSSQLAREEDLQKLVGDGGNKFCGVLSKFKAYATMNTFVE